MNFLIEYLLNTGQCLRVFNCEIKKLLHCFSLTH